MKKMLCLLIAFLSLVTFPVYGQRNKNVVYKIGVGELNYTHPENPNTAGKIIKNVAEALLTGQNSTPQPQYADAVRASIINGLSKVILFRPFDGVFSDDELSPAIPALYADGSIANISTVTKTETTTDKNGKKSTTNYYRALISVTVNLKNPYDGVVVNSHTFNLSESDLSWLGSNEKAISNALEYLSSKVSSYYNKVFPLYASIVEAGEAKKDKQKEVYIDLGAADGVYKGLQFDVFLVKTIAGKEAKTEIGRLKIEEVEGDDISLCKVKKGGDKIKNALDEGLTLLITSK